MADIKINGKTYEGVEEVQLPLADGSANAVFVPEGTGGDLPQPQLLCTITEEMNLKELLTAYPIPRKYESSLVLFMHRGANVATNGSGTYRHIIFYCNHGDASTDMFMVNAYTNSLVAPDTMELPPAAAANGNYFSISASDGSLTASGSTNTTRYFAVGNTIEYIEIPFDYNTLSMSPLS